MNYNEQKTETYIACGRGVEEAADIKVVVLALNDVEAVELVEDGEQRASIPVISDTTTVVTLSGQVAQGIKLDSLNTGQCHWWDMDEYTSYGRLTHLIWVQEKRIEFSQEKISCNRWLCHLQNQTHLFFHPYIIVIEEHGQLTDTDPEICLIELVWDVPTQRTKLPPLLDQCMEEAQAVQQFLPATLKQQQQQM